MIHDLSRLPMDYQRFCHYAYSFCTFDWRLLKWPRTDAFPILREGVGWFHPASSETGGPAFGMRIDDPKLRNWKLDYLGRPGPWASASNSFRSKIYIKLGAGEWTLAVHLHEELGHGVGFAIIDQDSVKRQQLADIYKLGPGPIDHHLYAPALLKAFTPLHIPEVSAELAAKVKGVVTS